MNRLTNKRCAVSLNIGKQIHDTDLYFDNEPIYEKTKQAIKKLAAYEDTDLEPSEVEELKHSRAVLGRALRKQAQLIARHNEAHYSLSSRVLETTVHPEMEDEVYKQLIQQAEQELKAEVKESGK